MASFPLPFRLTASGDMFFASYLFMVSFVLGRTSEHLRKRAAAEDEGIFVVVVLVLTAIAFCCGSIVVILHQSHGTITLPLAMALLGAPLGWFTLHVVAAFHYANLFYGPGVEISGEGGSPPLQFPGGRDPAAWDFLYYSFVVGMTAQVSDVQVIDATMRRATLGHGVVSFFFNTVLIAMAVNAVVTLAT
jgi:uncharacterized membrane protein